MLRRTDMAGGVLLIADRAKRDVSLERFNFVPRVMYCTPSVCTWPTSKMSPEAVSDDKLASTPGPVKREVVAAHTSLVVVPCRFATWVLSASTESGVGHEGRSCPALGATVPPPAAVSPRTFHELSARPSTESPNAPGSTVSVGPEASIRDRAICILRFDRC